VTLLFCSFLLIHLQQLLKIKVTNSTNSFIIISKISIMEHGPNSMGFRHLDLATITMASMLDQHLHQEHQVLLLNRIGTTNNGIIGITMVLISRNQPLNHKLVLTKEL